MIVKRAHLAKLHKIIAFKDLTKRNKKKKHNYVKSIWKEVSVLTKINVSSLMELNSFVAIIIRTTDIKLNNVQHFLKMVIVLMEKDVIFFMLAKSLKI